MSENDMIRKVLLLKELQRTIEDAEAEADAIKDEIKMTMGDTEELRAGMYKVTYKAVTSARIDTAELKRVVPDIAKAFTKTSTTRRFCIA